MTIRDTPFAAGTPSWVDLFSADTARAKEFYGGVFGWEATDTGEEFGGYVLFTSGGKQVAGMMHNDGAQGTPDMWSTYISVDNAAITQASAEAAGAQVLAPTMPVGSLGHMAVLLDPAGGVFGLWQAGEHTGFQKYNEPGSVSWNEYHSKNFIASQGFYGALFDWQYDVLGDTEEFRYVTEKVDGRTVGGMMDSASFLPEQVPSHWAVYFSVVDTDAALKKVVELGGAVVRPAEDTPFGRMADVIDPTGAPFKLHSATLSTGEVIPAVE